MLRPSWCKLLSRPWPIGEMLTVARGVFFQWLGVARDGFLWLFLSGEWLGAFFLPSFPVADNVHNTRVQRSEVVSCPSPRNNSTNQTAPRERASVNGTVAVPRWVCP